MDGGAIKDGVLGVAFVFVGSWFLRRGNRSIRQGPLSLRFYVICSALLAIGVGLLQLAKAFHLAWVTVELRIAVLSTLIVLCFVSWFFAGRAQKKCLGETP